MLNLNQFNVLRELVDRRLSADGFIWVGIADFFTVEELDDFKTLIELGYIEFIVREGWNDIKPKDKFGYREWPHLLTTLGMAVMICPSVFLERAFPY